MSRPLVDLTKQDFDSIQWESYLNDFNSNDDSSWFTYSGIFMDKAQEAENQKDERTQAAFILLGDIMSLCLKVEDNNSEQPFQPMFVWGDGKRSAILQDFSEEQLKVLSEILTTITNPVIKARIADILWIRDRRSYYTMGKIAIENYIILAKNSKPEKFSDFADTINQILPRAMQLAHQRGNHDQKESVVQCIQAIITQGETLKIYDTLALIQLLQKYKSLYQGDAPLVDKQLYADESVKLAEKAVSEKDFFAAQGAYDVAARWFQLLNNSEKEKEIKILAAELSVQMADVDNSQQSKLNVAHHLATAYQRFLSIGGTENRREEIHTQLLKAQEASVSEMVTISSEKLDITQYIEETEKAVQGKTAREILFYMMRECCSPSVQSLRQSIEERAKGNSLLDLFTHTLSDEKGRTVAQRRGLWANTPEERETAIISQMYEAAQTQRQIQIIIGIEPCRSVLLTEHNPNIDFFDEYIYYNPFIPFGREELFRRGLYEGLRGDFLVSTHLLMPQIENSLRYVLERSGKASSKVVKDGLQEDMNLSDLLSDSMPEKGKNILIEILGEDIVFDLQSLLNEKASVNLRNEVAHGKVDAETFYGHTAVYFWWLVLRICLLCKVIVKPYTQT